MHPPSHALTHPYLTTSSILPYFLLFNFSILNIILIIELIRNKKNRIQPAHAEAMTPNILERGEIELKIEHNSRYSAVR